MIRKIKPNPSITTMRMENKTGTVRGVLSSLASFLVGRNCLADNGRIVSPCQRELAAPDWGPGQYRPLAVNKA